MTNRSRSLRTVLSLLLAGCGCGMLSGCIVMVVPAATGGLIAKSIARRDGNANAAVASAGTATPVASLAAGQPITAGANLSPFPVNGGSSAKRKTSEVSALVVPGSDGAMTPPVVGGAASTWYDVIRFEAKSALGTPDERRVDVLRPSKNTSPTLCGSRPTAVLIDTATIGAADYSYVGSLRTMGYVILLTTSLPALSNSQRDALAKEGIPVPYPGETLFLKYLASDIGARSHILSRYCVVGLVGGQANDFPGAVLPGTHDAHLGWFLIAKP